MRATTILLSPSLSEKNTSKKITLLFLQGGSQLNACTGMHVLASIIRVLTKLLKTFSSTQT